MAALLDDLELLAVDHPEIEDTDVRERLAALVEVQLLNQESDVSVPADLGMLTEEGNHRLHTLMTEHISRLREVFAVFGLTTREQRAASFFNPKLRSSRGQLGVDHFFGAP